MSSHARVCLHEGQPWMVVEARGQSGLPVCVYDGPLDLSSKKVIRAEIDWIHQQTGVPRPDLYDCIRQYTNKTSRAA